MVKHMTKEILELMGDGRGYRAPEIAQKTGLTSKQAGNALARLAHIGRLERGERGVYFVMNGHALRPDPDPHLRYGLDTVAEVWSALFDIPVTCDQVRIALLVAEGLKDQ